MAPLNYKGKVVIITDGSTPTGQLYGSFFKARGASVVLNTPPTSKSSILQQV